MRKTKFLVCLLVVLTAFLLVACTNNKTYTISFETNGGEKIESVVIEGDGTLQAPAEPKKEGHKFLGWFLDEACEQPVTDFSALKFEADTTLYAKWQINTYTVTFNTVGGSAVDNQTVEHGKAVAIPANPTKEGYEFAGWYLKQDYSKAYANDLIKADTTLYARWRSALRYAGSFDGEGKYDSETGAYTFTVQLQLWGRIRLAYKGELLSMDDEDLTVTGAFTSANQAPWTPELYCDVPDETSTEIDWTTLINSCANPVNYTFTYNPTDHSLDIQAEEILPAIPEVPAEGLYIELYDNNKAFVEGYKPEASEDGSYTGSVTMKQWWRIRVYYNGQALSTNSVTITGDFEGYNPKNKDLYVDTEYETEYDILCDYASEGVPYEITYNPETNTLDIQDDEPEQEVVIPTEGLYYEHTAPDTTLMAPEKVEISEDGTYKIVLDLAAWRYVVIYYNGVVVDSADANLTSSLSGGVYIDDTGAPSSRFYVNAVGKYQFVYTPAADGANASLVAGKYVEPQDPDGKDDFKFTVSSDQYGVIFTEGSVDTKSKWRFYIIVTAEGKIAYMCDMPINGYGGIGSDSFARHSSFADHNNNPAFSGDAIVVPAGGFALELYSGADGAASVKDLIQAITGAAYVQHGVNTNTLDVDKVRLALADGVVTVTYVEEETPVEPEDFTFAVSSDEYAVVFTEGSVDTLSKWRLYIVVDGEGKIAYMCEMPINGYGGMASDTYIRHSSYADAANNPAFSDGAVVVPQGGYVLELFQGNANVQALMTAITGLAYAEHAINTNTINVDAIRLTLVDGVVTVSTVEEPVTPPAEKVEVTFGGTLSGNAVYDEATGNYEMVADLKTWNNIILYVNGAAVSVKDLTVSGLFNPNAGADWTENLYYEGEDTTKLFTCTGGKYVLVYNHSAATLNISLYSVTYGGTLSGNVNYNATLGAYEAVVELATWNHIILYVNGKAVSVKDLTVTGLLNPNQGADWTENLYCEGDDFTKLYTCTGGKYVLALNPDAKTLNISLYVEPEAFKFAVSSDEYAAVFTEGSVDTLSKWRLYIVVDGEGKIAYMCEMPINGYGGMASDTYIRHSSYADAANNPAFSDGAVVVPQGGYVLELFQGNANVQALMTAITGIAYAEHAINTNTINVDAIRLTLVDGVVTVNK